MEKKKIEIIVTVGLIAVFVLLFISMLKKRVEKVPKGVPQEDTLTEAVKPVSVKDTKPIEVGELYWGRDPFVVAQRKHKARKTPFVLTAVIWDEKEPHAIVNGEIVIVGQEINGYSITEITKHSAVLKKGDKELNIELFE